MAGYITDDNLTDAYIQSLITRNGFQDVTAENENGYPYVIQDLNGQLNNVGSMGMARDWLISQYVIIQNS